MDEQQKAEVITPPVVNETPQVQEMTSFFKEEVVAPVNETPVVNEVEETPIAEEPFMFIKNEAKEETPIAEVEEKKQITFEFEITNNNSNAVSFEEPFIISKSEETVMQNDFVIENKEENKTIAEVQQDEQLKKAQDRIEKLKQLSFKLKSPNGLSELENEPAYKRRNISLDSTPHSSESQVSRYTLSEGDDKKIEIKPNNSFLHDNVD